MPEGPEIRRSADALADVLVDKQLKRVNFAFPELRRFETRLRRSKIINIESRGKALLTHFDNALSIYSHNQLYGVWKIFDGHELPESSRQIRLLLATPKHSAVLYSASDIHVNSSEKIFDHPYLAKLGPDLLSDNTSSDEIVDRLKEQRFCRKTLAQLLLDQSFLAGIGNYLRAEILAFARLHPLRRPIDCSAKELLRLANNIRVITTRAYKKAGVTNTPTQVKILKEKGITHYEGYRFWVYARENKHCYRCGSLNERINAGSRHVAFCPRCQPLPA